MSNYQTLIQAANLAYMSTDTPAGHDRVSDQINYIHDQFSSGLISWTEALSAAKAI